MEFEKYEIENIGWLSDAWVSLVAARLISSRLSVTSINTKPWPVGDKVVDEVLDMIDTMSLDTAHQLNLLTREELVTAIYEYKESEKEEKEFEIQKMKDLENSQNNHE